MIIETGRTLRDGTAIKLGDKIQGSQTAELLVLSDEENKECGVEIVGRSDFWWTIDYILSKWSDLKKRGNVNKRTPFKTDHSE